MSKYGVEREEASVVACSFVVDDGCCTGGALVGRGSYSNGEKLPLIEFLVDKEEAL